MAGQLWNGKPLSAAIIEFAGVLRAAGFYIGVQESQDAVQAASLGLFTQRNVFRYALAAIFCQDAEQRQQFDLAFETFWQREPAVSKKSEKRIRVDKFQTVNQPRSIVMLGQGKSDQESATGESVSGANRIERLRKTDFSKLTEAEHQELDDLARRLFRQMYSRLSRRFREKAHRGVLNFALTQRKNLQSGGDPLFLEYRKQGLRKPRLLVLLDVSGSMDKYSFYLLKFLFALHQCFEHMESFVFSTKLVRITGMLQNKGLDYCLELLGQRTDHWSSGTQIGNCLAEFNLQYARRIMNSNTTTVILSDGLDTGQPENLGSELKLLRKRCKLLVWLNPLKGSVDYSPEARGMKAALPHIDNFSSGHNLESLLELETLLTHV